MESWLPSPPKQFMDLGADDQSQKAVARIYRAKGRPTDHPLIFHIASQEPMSDWVTEIPEFASLLASAFWPGPMTLILKRSDLARTAALWLWSIKSQYCLTIGHLSSVGRAAPS